MSFDSFVTGSIRAGASIGVPKIKSGPVKSIPQSPVEQKEAAVYSGQVARANVKELKPILKPVDVSARFDVYPDPELESEEVQDQSSGSAKVEDVSASRDVKSDKLPPMLSSLNTVAPGWGDKIAMLDINGDPDRNRMVYDQLMEALEADKDLSKEAKMLVTNTLLHKAYEIKAADKAGVYGVKLENKEDVAFMEAMNRIERARWESEMNYLRAILTWWDLETGEKHEPNLPHSMPEHIAALQDYQVKRAESRNQEVAQRNNERWNKASRLDRDASSFESCKKESDDFKAKHSDACKAIALKDKVDGANKLILQGISPQAREKILQRLTQDLDGIFPEMKVTQDEVNKLLLDYKPVAKAG